MFELTDLQQPQITELMNSEEGRHSNVTVTLPMCFALQGTCSLDRLKTKSYCLARIIT